MFLNPQRPLMKRENKLEHTSTYENIVIWRNSHQKMKSRQHYIRKIHILAMRLKNRSLISTNRSRSQFRCWPFNSNNPHRHQHASKALIFSCIIWLLSISISLFIIHNAICIQLDTCISFNEYQIAAARVMSTVKTNNKI